MQDAQHGQGPSDPLTHWAWEGARLAGNMQMNYTRLCRMQQFVIKRRRTFMPFHGLGLGGCTPGG